MTEVPARDRPDEVISMGRAIRLVAAEHPDRPVITMGGRHLTWSELDRASDRLAHVLVEKGARPGDAVTVILPNGFAFFQTVVAIWKIGGTPHLLSPRMTPIELTQLLELAAPAVVVTDLDVVAPAPVVRPDVAEDGETTLAQAHGDVAPRCWMAFASGGSTGRPKIVVAEQAGVVGGGSDIDIFTRSYQMDRDTVLLIPGPLCHSGPFGLATYTLFAGGRVIVMDRFDPEDALRVIQRDRATKVFLVPTMMNRIMQLDPAVRASYDVSSLRTVWHAAAPCPPWLKQAWIDWLGPERIDEGYGASDAAGMTSINGTEWLEHRGSVGRAVFGEFAIFGDDGKPLPNGQIGDIYMRPPEGAMHRTYIGAPPPTTRDGWSTVGDMGWLDDEGYLYLADRRTDLIITGALNVYPAEVEGALEEHPLVLSCVVVGVPDDDLGKRIHAVVQVASPVEVDDLRAFARERLSPYKVPHSFEFVDEQIRDEAGKVRRSAIAARVAATAPSGPAA